MEHFEKMCGKAHEQAQLSSWKTRICILWNVMVDSWITWLVFGQAGLLENIVMVGIIINVEKIISMP